MSPTAQLNLADDQRFALMKFRRNMSDCVLPPSSDDYYLLRWLKARNFNLEAAEKMLRESLRWRERVDADHLISKWTPPEVLTRHFPSGVCGFDKDNIPVAVVLFGRLDLWGLIHSTSKLDFVKMIARTLEEYLVEASRISRELGRPSSAPQVNIIIDLEGLQMKQFCTSKIVLETIINWAQIFEANYPEVLKYCFIINAPSVCFISFSIMRPFFRDKTVLKMQMFGPNPHKWKPVLLQHIDAEQLPVCYGGTKTGADGDPKCSDKIHGGGIVPKSMYLSEVSKCEGIIDTWTTQTVKKKEKIKLVFSVTPDQTRSHLKWIFYVEKSDIHFAVYKNSPQNKKSIMLEPRRISGTSKSSPEVGMFLCEEPANYVVEFENDSLLRSKKVHYQIVIALPLKANTTN